jgi:hypothetical protein
MLDLVELHSIVAAWVFCVILCCLSRYGYNIIIYIYKNVSVRLFMTSNLRK